MRRKKEKKGGRGCRSDGAPVALKEVNDRLLHPWLDSGVYHGQQTQFCCCDGVSATVGSAPAHARPRQAAQGHEPRACPGREEGNGNVGHIVMAVAAKHLTPVALELGGKCPIIVDSNIDLHVVVKRIAVGKWGCNNGQACIAPDYIVDSLKRVLERFYGQDPLQSADLFRIVNSNHFHRLINLIEDKKVAKKIVLGGQTDEKQLKIAPTVLVDVTPDSALMTGEIFGPFLRIVTVDKIEESIDFINIGTKPLAAYLFTKGKKLQEDFVSSRSNARQRRRPAWASATAGWGPTKFNFDCFSHKKAVLIRGFGGEATASWKVLALCLTHICHSYLNI